MAQTQRSPIRTTAPDRRDPADRDDRLIFCNCMPQLRSDWGSGFDTEQPGVRHLYEHVNLEWQV